MERELIHRVPWGGIIGHRYPEPSDIELDPDGVDLVLGGLLGRGRVRLPLRAAGVQRPAEPIPERAHGPRSPADLGHVALFVVRSLRCGSMAKPKSKPKSVTKPKSKARSAAKPKSKAKSNPEPRSSQEFLITFEVAILKADGTYTTDSIDLTNAQNHSHEEVATAYRDEHPELDPEVVLAVIAHQ
jgi:hypothetical protein